MNHTVLHLFSEYLLQSDQKQSSATWHEYLQLNCNTIGLQQLTFAEP